MPEFIYKDYFLAGGTLCKFHLNESKHLLHSQQSVPCIDAELWDKHKNLIKAIRFQTNKGRIFRVRANIFDKEKQEIDFGFGKQYFIEKDLWDIIELSKKEKPIPPTQKEFYF